MGFAIVRSTKWASEKDFVALIDTLEELINALASKKVHRLQKSDPKTTK